MPPSCATTNGYSQSKWVSEAILHKAGEITGLRSVVVRIGQVSGGQPSGYWNEMDWFPAMVKSSLGMGCFPSGNQVSKQISPLYCDCGHGRHSLIIPFCPLKVISWIPLDLASRALIELRDSTSPVVHLVHSKPATWSVVAEAISSKFGLYLVQYSEWLKYLEKRASSHNSGGSDDSELDGDRIPAESLLLFFQQAKASMKNSKIGCEAMGLATLDCRQAKLGSATLRDDEGLREIRSEEVTLWIDDWKTRGYL